MLPDLPQKSFIEPIAKSLLFLHEDYYLDFIDPFDISGGVPGDAYFQHCQLWMKKVIAQYDAFFGFSFGGVILQQCFPLLERVNKPVVLFSAPAFADDALQKKLGGVISLCKAKRIDDALTMLYQHVFYPNKMVQNSFELTNKDDAAARLVFGLQHVLDTNSRPILQRTTVEYLHFIGECSDLVNTKNVIVAKKGQLFLVPHAGMRVLQDNLAFCKQRILESLNKGS